MGAVVGACVCVYVCACLSVRDTHKSRSVKQFLLVGNAGGAEASNLEVGLACGGAAVLVQRA